MKLIALLLISGSSLFASDGFIGDNDPKYIAPNADARFSNLPLKAELTSEKTPWANSFWPNIYGGIAFRWNGYYDGEPSFASHHYQVNAINDEIEELEKDLYKEQHSVEENKRIVARMLALKNEKLEVISRKSAQHKKYFFDIQRLKKASQAKLLSQEELDKLSPTEKYDIYKWMQSGNDNSMTLTKDVLDHTNPYDAFWEGVCHGWTSAALEFKEPIPQSFTGQGITLNFGSSDLKALLSYYHAAITKNWIANKKVATGRVGERCDVAFSEHAWFIKDGKEYYKTIKNGRVYTNPVPPDCVDTNPGAFHIVISNMIGLRNEGFSAEMVRDKEVWNQPVYKYETTVENTTYALRRNATRGTAKQIKVKTIVYYANDGGRMYWRDDGSDDEFYAWWNPTNGTANYRFASKELRYWLDLNGQGEIIGGQWLSYERPDFLWLKKTKGFIGTGTFFGIVNYLDDLKYLSKLQ